MILFCCSSVIKRIVSEKLRVFKYFHFIYRPPPTSGIGELKAIGLLFDGESGASSSTRMGGGEGAAGRSHWGDHGVGPHVREDARLLGRPVVGHKRSSEEGGDVMKTKKVYVKPSLKKLGLLRLLTRLTF